MEASGQPRVGLDGKFALCGTRTWSHQVATEYMSVDLGTDVGGDRISGVARVEMCLLKRSGQFFPIYRKAERM